MNGPSFVGELSIYYLSLPGARYFVVKLVSRGDALSKPLLPDLYEPVRTIAGNGTRKARFCSKIDFSFSARRSLVVPV